MRNVWLAMAIACLMGGCAEHAYSERKEEPATVADLIYSPAQHGSGVGFTPKGDVSIVSVDTDPRYAVIFECPHGRFVIDHNQSKTRELYGRLHRGDRVVVAYREIFEVRKDGRHLVGYDFLDAQRVPQ